MSDTQSGTRAVVIVAADLIFGARIRAAASDAGVRALFARNQEQLRSAAAAADLVILDLDTRWLEAGADIRSLKQDPITAAKPVIAFVSHVRADLIDAARAAGADRVLARSAFVQQLPDILAAL